MDNYEMLILERKLEDARYDLMKLFSSNKDFYVDLIKILDRYKTSRFETKRFVIKFSTLFRIITDRVQAKDLDVREYSEMRLCVETLESRYPNEFLEFVSIVKHHVINRKTLGYNHIYRMIYGESTWDISKNNIDEIYLEQTIDNKISIKVPEKTLSQIVDDYRSGGEGEFDKTIPYNLVVDGLDLEVFAEINLEVKKEKK